MRTLLASLKQTFISFFRTIAVPKSEFVLCSDCFHDQGLKLDAEQFGVDDHHPCNCCGRSTGRKLTKRAIGQLSHRFFVWGTLLRCEYGAAPIVQFNDKRKSDISTSSWFADDLKLIEKAIGVGFFYYGPRTWMVGEVGPLKALQGSRKTRRTIIDRIITEYPSIGLPPSAIFYRVRKSPANPVAAGEYDSPPIPLVGTGRLDSINFPVMYGSQDLPTCIHECRVTAEDNLFFATLAPRRDLKLLDLTELLYEDGVTEFESLDMAVHMLFLAGDHAYPIARAITRTAKYEGFDGLVYPSYFSMLRTGQMPFETTYGISHRVVKRLAQYEKSNILPNIALFGRPIEDGSIRVNCIDRLIVNTVDYGFHFGPVESNLIR